MKKFLSIILVAVFMIGTFSVASFAKSDYTIDSPYKDVIWDGNGAWGAYKGNLHTHSTVSDADVDFNEMIIEHYKQGFDFLAMTDHAITGKDWNKEPTHIPLYLYQYIIGNKTTRLTDEEFEGITTGTYPVDGEARGYGMTCVAGGNELNGLTITKCHVNGMFLPTNKGNNHLGYENDHEGAVKLAEKYGGVSFINHPGDWLRSNHDISVVSDPANVKYFSDILLKYDTCLGMEVFNEKNSVTPYDRILWDNILMETLPYGKNVIGYSNNDAHTLDLVDSSFEVFMMEENNVENIEKTMSSGAFFCVTRNLRANDIIGPAEDFNVRNQGLPYPEFTQLTVDGHQVTIQAKNCKNIQWIANGKVIATKDVEQSEDATTYVLDLDTIDGAEDFLYIRCELLGEGGMTLSQPLVIDNGTEPLTYTPDTSFKAKVQNFWHRFISLRLFALIDLLIYKLK